MNVNLEISIGEFFDKITILEINKELDGLNGLLGKLSFSREDVADEVSELKKINEALWVIEDDIREKESQKAFDDRFIELARAVYVTNDKRSVIKRDINLKLGFDFVEEKSYEEY